MYSSGSSITQGEEHMPVSVLTAAGPRWVRGTGGLFLSTNKGGQS